MIRWEMSINHQSIRQQESICDHLTPSPRFGLMSGLLVGREISDGTPMLSTPIILPRVGFYVVAVVFRLCLTRPGWSEFGLDTRKSDAGDIFRDIPNDRNHLNRSRNARFLPKARIKSRRHEEVSLAQDRGFSQV